jgi:hypothetical protein
MKWFFALNALTEHLTAYADMVKVAVVTARRHTTLEPVFLYDGPPNELTAWLQGRGVEIVERRTRLYEALAALAAEKRDPFILQCGAGAFLRLEIPSLCVERGWPDRDVFYTDCDVMFTGPVVDLLPDLRGYFIGAAPEGEQDNPDFINSGVMLMRVPSLLRLEEPFWQFVHEKLARMVTFGWDQAAYQWFYRHGWKHLAAEMNWKPYWGVNAGARIVHFHGPKPFHRAALAHGVALPQQRELARGEGFAHYCALWDAALAEAEV